jgi:hypothetical protein
MTPMAITTTSPGPIPSVSSTAGIERTPRPICVFTIKTAVPSHPTYSEVSSVQLEVGGSSHFCSLDHPPLSRQRCHRRSIYDGLEQTCDALKEGCAGRWSPFSPSPQADSRTECPSRLASPWCAIAGRDCKRSKGRSEQAKASFGARLPPGLQYKHMGSPSLGRHLCPANGSRAKHAVRDS